MKITFALLISLSGGTVAFGQSCAPNCQAPCVSVPTAPVPAQSGPIQQPGAFVTGPPSGEVEGESSSMGLRFGTLRIPELTIPFPTFQLPSLVRYRRDAQMITQGQSAPFVRGPVSNFNLQPAEGQSGPITPEQPVPGQSGPITPQQCVPYCPPACAAPNCTSSEVRNLEIQVAQLKGLVEQLAVLQLQNSGMTNQQPEAVSGLASRAQPMGWQPPLSTQQQQLASQYEQKCQESEALRAQLAELQQSYQQLLAAEQRQIVAQREDRLRQQMDQPVVVAPAATQTTAPRPMPAVMRNVEPASYQEAVVVPTLYQPSSSDEVFGEPTELAGQYQWRQPEPQPRRTAARTETDTRTPSSQPAAQSQTGTARQKEEGKLSKGLLSRWFGGRK